MPLLILIKLMRCHRSRSNPAYLLWRDQIKGRKLFEKGNCLLKTLKDNLRENQKGIPRQCAHIDLIWCFTYITLFIYIRSQPFYIPFFSPSSFIFVGFVGLDMYGRLNQHDISGRLKWVKNIFSELRNCCTPICIFKPPSCLLPWIQLGTYKL